MLVTLWLVVPLLRLAVDEVSVPTDRTARAVPSGVEVVTSEERCGSGGCWRDLTLRWPGRSATDLRARLDLAPDGTTQRCRAASVLDLRRACVGVDDVLSPQSGAPDLLRVEVWWRRPGWR